MRPLALATSLVGGNVLAAAGRGLISCIASVRTVVASNAAEVRDGAAIVSR